MCRMCAAAFGLALSLTLPAGTADITKETELGKILAAELDRKFQPVRDEFITGYVFGLAQRLAVNASLSFPIQLKLLETDEVIANALPGGYLVLSSTLIGSTGSESELAHALAHEIAHIAARHGTTQRPGKTMPFVFVGGSTGICPRFDRQQNVLPSAFLQASRAWEEEADRLGGEYLAKAGFNAGEPGNPAFEDVKRRIANRTESPRKGAPPSLRRPAPK